MPFTFLAHQAPVLPLKILRPRWFDGTALCIGAMAPDFAYPLGAWLQRQSHTAIGIVVWSLPCTLVVCWALRSWVADTAFAQLPDIRWLRLHSYRVLARRRPPVWQTLVSALLGAGIHVLIDGFTHARRFGARWLGYDTTFVDLPIRADVALARLLQDSAHLFGSLLCIALLAFIARRRLLEQWYGAEIVRGVRAFTLRPAQRVAFWATVASGLPIGLAWAASTTGVAPFRLFVALAFSTAVACAVPLCRPIASHRAVVPHR